jgi:hypothetical protein
MKVKILLCLSLLASVTTAQTMHATIRGNVAEGQYWCLIFTQALPVSFANYHYNHKWIAKEGTLGGVGAQLILGRGESAPSGEIKGSCLVSGGLGLFQGQGSTAIALTLGLAYLQGMVGYDFATSQPVVGFGVSVALTQFTSIGTVLLWKKLIVK